MQNASPARLYALVFGAVLVVAGIIGFFYESELTGLGVVYIAVALWGFIVGDGDSILSIVPVNTEDNVLHLVIGLAGLAAGAASAGEAAPRVQRAT